MCAKGIYFFCIASKKLSVKYSPFWCFAPHLGKVWKKIQEKTFTRWCNEYLRVQGIQIKDISTDFSDGVCLVTLLQVLSQKKVGKYNKKPRLRVHKLENVQLSLRFIESEKIRLVNIGKMH